MINEEGGRFSRWGLPVAAVSLGSISPFLLFPTFLGVLPGLSVASAGSLCGVYTLSSSRSPRQKLLGGIGCLSLPMAAAYLHFRPLWLDDVLATPVVWLLYQLTPM